VAVVGDEDHDRIIRMEENISYIRKKFDTQCAWQKSTDHRIGALENWRSALAGGFGLLVLLMGYGWIVPRL
jgi:hypothetical protein